MGVANELKVMFTCRIALVVSMMVSLGCLSELGGDAGGTAGGRADDVADVQQQDEFLEQGIASWYGPGFIGSTTAHCRNGGYCEVFTGDQMTAAHKTLPMNTWVRVTKTADGSSAIVRINDRGPYVDGRVIDLSPVAADELGIGLAEVTLHSVEPPPGEFGGQEVQFRYNPAD